jgi:hypothetical protein
MGSCLPSAGQVLIIRPAGKKGRRRNAPLGLLSSRGPARKPSIPVQVPNRVRSRRNAVAAEVLEKTFPRKQFPNRIKEPY